MARYAVNAFCNVVTGVHSEAYRREGELPSPEVTIPRYRARLSIREADMLSRALAQAVELAQKKERGQAE
jgi:hypothetical protein